MRVGEIHAAIYVGFLLPLESQIVIQDRAVAVIGVATLDRGIARLLVDLRDLILERFVLHVASSADLPCNSFASATARHFWKLPQALRFCARHVGVLNAAGALLAQRSRATTAANIASRMASLLVAGPARCAGDRLSFWNRGRGQTTEADTSAENGTDVVMRKSSSPMESLAVDGLRDALLVFRSFFV